MFKRRGFSAEFKIRVALEALRGDRSAQEIASRHGVRPRQVSAWKLQALEGLEAVFSNDGARTLRDREAELRALHARIDKLTAERNFLLRGLKGGARMFVRRWAGKLASLWRGRRSRRWSGRLAGRRGAKRTTRRAGSRAKR